jgi:hypothetical protein
MLGATASLLACNAISGVGDYQFGSTTGGGATSTGGSGGSTTTSSATGGQGAGAVGGGGASPDWYDPSFAFRRKLTLDHAAGTESLTDFPVLVQLDSSRITYGSVQGDGRDVRFVDDDDATLLSYEIEQWDGAGTSIVWVEVPDVPAGSSERFIWMYYGNPSASDAQDPTGTWSNGYAAVWHLDPSLENAAGSALDGTSFATVDAPGILGRAREFNGTTSEVAFTDPSTLDGLFAGGATITAWIYPRTFGENSRGRIVDRATSTAFQNGWGLILNNPGAGGHLALGRGFTTQFGAWATPDGSILVDAWQHVAAVYDEDDTAPAELWIDGSAQTVHASFVPAGTLESDIGSPLGIGNNAASNNRTFDGYLDEIRIAAVPRSGSWIEAQYRSTTDAMVTYGSEEAHP